MQGVLLLVTLCAPEGAEQRGLTEGILEYHVALRSACEQLSL